MRPGAAGSVEGGDELPVLGLPADQRDEGGGLHDGVRRRGATTGWLACPLFGPLHQRYRLRRRLCVQFARQRGPALCVSGADRRFVSARQVQAHQAAVGRFVQGVVLKPALAGSDGRLCLPSFRLHLREAVKNRFHLPVGLLPPQRCPVVEGRSVLQRKAIEEIAPVSVHDPLQQGQRPAPGCSLQLVPVGTEIGVAAKPQRVSLHVQVGRLPLVAQRPAQVDEGVAQIGAAAAGVILRPEDGGQLFTPVHPLLNGQIDEEGQRLARAKIHGFVVVAHGGRAQK